MAASEQWGPVVRGRGVIAAWQRRPADEVSVPHTSNEVIVHLGPLQRREARLGGSRLHAFSAPPGTVEVIPAGADAWGRWTQPKNTVHFTLSPAKLDEVARLEFDRDGVLLGKFPGATSHPAIFRIACLMQEELERSGGEVPELYLDSCATLLAYHLIQSYSGAATPKPALSPKVRGLAAEARAAVLEYMGSHLSRTLSVAQLAAVAGLSPNHFLAAFREEMGSTPHQYLLGLRVAAAERELREGIQPLSAIAYTAGFSSQSHMTVAFRRFRGRTPGSYRRLVSEASAV